MCPTDPPDRVDGAPVPVEQGELERLRALVGPDERSYAELLADVAAAREAARLAEGRAGELRGALTESEVEILRLRQQVVHVRRPMPRRLVSALRRRGRSVLAGVRR